MYDWPEERDATDALWQRMANALAEAGFKAPPTLTRDRDVEQLWTASDLLVAETCTWPLATFLSGKVHYVGTLDRASLGCGDGYYRSVVIAATTARWPEQADSPGHDNAVLPDLTGATLAINGDSSLSGYVALAADAGISLTVAMRTGSHRNSICAVASGMADIAAIDAYSWRLARRHEPMAGYVRVIGWTARRPALTLITGLWAQPDDLSRMRAALSAAVPMVIHDDPLAHLKV